MLFGRVVFERGVRSERAKDGRLDGETTCSSRWCGEDEGDNAEEDDEVK